MGAEQLKDSRDAACVWTTGEQRWKPICHGRSIIVHKRGDEEFGGMDTCQP